MDPGEVLLLGLGIAVLAGILVQNVLDLGQRQRDHHLAKVARMLDAVDRLMASERFDDAFLEAQRALKHAERRLSDDHPLMLDALYLVGVLHVAWSRWLEAKEVLDRLLSVADTQNASSNALVACALEESARCSAQLGDEAVARRLLDQAEALRMEFLPATLIENLEMRARVARVLGCLDEADSLYGMVIAHLGGASKQGPYRGSLQRQERALSLDNVTAYDAHANRALVLLMSDREEKGMAELSRACSTLASELNNNSHKRVRVLQRWAKKCEAAGFLESARSVPGDRDERAGTTAIG